MQASANSDYCSCFLIKTQLELAAEGGDLHSYTIKRLAATESLYRDYLQQVFSAEQSAAYASSLMLHIFGIRVYGYQKGSIERMRTGLQAGLPWLPWTD